MQTEIDELKSQISESQNEDKDMEILLLKDDHQQEINSLTDVTKGKAKAEIGVDQMTQTINEQQSEIEDSKLLKAQIEEYRMQVQNYKLQLNSENQQQITENNDKLLLEQISSLEAINTDLQAVNNQIKEQNQQFQIQINDFKQQQQNDQELIDRLQIEVEKRQAQVVKLEQQSEENEEIEQMQEMIASLQQEDEEQKKQVLALQTTTKELQKQLKQESDRNEKLKLHIDQKILENKEEKEKVSSLEEELMKFEQKHKDVVESKQQISMAYQQASSDLLQLSELQSDNAQLQVLLNSKSEELEQLKTNNIYETKYLELNADFEQFKEYVSDQFQKKENEIALAAQYLQDYETCKEQLAMLEQQCQLLQEQLNRQMETYQQLQEQYEYSLEQNKLLNNNSNQLLEISAQCQFFKQEIEKLKSDNYFQQENIQELEAQLQNQQQIECDSPKKLEKLQSEFAENQSEFCSFKEQATREIHLFKQDKTTLQSELQQMKEMIDAFLIQDTSFSTQIHTVQEYYEKLLDFSDDFAKIITKKDEQFVKYQEEMNNKHKIQRKDQSIQYQVELIEREASTIALNLSDQSTQTELIENSLSGSMWLNSDVVLSKEDQFQSMKKKKEDLDSLLKNYEKEVTNLKQHNKMLQKKIDSNTKPNTQDRLGKRVSLFEQNLGPRKSKQFHLNLCESQAIDDQQREISFMKDLIENLKKENKQFQAQTAELQTQVAEYKQLQDKYMDEQNRLEDQLQSQILINQTRNKSVDYNNQTSISQVTNTMVQNYFQLQNHKEIFNFHILNLAESKISFLLKDKLSFSRKVRHELRNKSMRLLHLTIFSQINKRQEPTSPFMGKLVQIRVECSQQLANQVCYHLILSETQKKYLMVIFLDLYYCLLKEQKLKQNLKLKVQISYQERVGNNWINLEQLGSEILIANDNIEQSHQQLELMIQNIKFYLFGKNQQAKQFGKEKVRQLTITYSVLFREQTYTQQFIIVTIPMVIRCEFSRFVKKVLNHTVSTNFRYYCLLSLNPILLHYLPSVDIMYFAKIVYAQNNQEELHKQMKIDDESVKQVRQATGQVVIKNQEIDILKKQLEYIKKQLNDQQQKTEIKQQMNQQIICHLSNMIVDIKVKMNNSKTAKTPKQCPELLFYEKLIAQLENITRRLTPISQTLNTDRSISPKIQNC